LIAEHIARYYNAIVWAVNQYLPELLPRVKERMQRKIHIQPK